MTESLASSAPAAFADRLAERARNAAADRRRNVRRTASAVAVVLVHILALSIFIWGSELPEIHRIKETIPEAITWIPIPKLAPPSKKPPPPAKKPEPVEAPPPVIPAPITLPPIRPKPLPEAPSGGLEGIGRSLACGASNYEYLPPAIREQCLRMPWAFVKKPDGTIVLAGPPKPIVPDQPSAAEIYRHEQETAPPCPPLSNVPCLGKVLHGDPLGGHVPF